MLEVLAGFIFICFLAAAWVLWREAQFQRQGIRSADLPGAAAATSAYIALAAAMVSATYRLIFILIGLSIIVDWGQAAGISQMVLASIFLVMIGGGEMLIGRAARGASLWAVDRRLKLNRTSLKEFLGDTAKDLVISGALALPLIIGWTYLAETKPAHWWLWAWAFWFAILAARLVIRPYAEARIIGKSHDLPSSDLRQRLEQLLDRCGLRVHKLRVLDASRRTKRVNASVTGFGGRMHVVLHDTLMEQLRPSEIEAVVAHEAGHVRHHHFERKLAGLALLGLVGAYGISWVAVAAELSPAETIGLMLATYASVLFCLRPLMVHISRGFEFQADEFAANQVGAAAVRLALAKIFAANHGVLDHHWAYTAIFAGHPSGRERLSRLDTMDHRS